MSAGPLVVEIICTCLLAAYVLHRYSDVRKQRVLVTLTTFIAWYFSFMIIFILPLDVSSTFYRQCLEDHSIVVSTTPTTPSNNTQVPETSTSSNITERSLQVLQNTSVTSPTHTVRPGCLVPTSHVPDHVLPTLWHVVYWTSQVLTWLFLPLMQSYSNAGDFTIAGKIKSALIENAIYYGTYLLIFGVCLIYVAARPDLHIDADKLKVIGVTASNTWGLFVLVLMLGYGLVDVPRSLWNNAKRGHQLSKTHFKIAKLSTEKTEAEEALEDILEEIKRTAERIRYNHPLRKHMDTILAKCPESMRHSVRGNMDDFEEYDQPQDTASEKSLVKLHKKVIRCLQIANRTQIQWNNLIQKAQNLEDVEANDNNPNKHFHRSYGSYSGVFRAIYTPTVEWYWKCRIRAWVMMIASIVLMIFSFMVVWSECLFFVKKPVLSLFAVFIDIAKQHYDYVYIEFASILTIAYLCFCAYYSVFQIRIFNYYYIASHHQTDEYSLIFTGMMLCRLTPPMCLNFLGLIHLDSHVTSVNNQVETSYTQIMGHMDVISFIANGFNIYFPILIVLLCFCTYFSLGSRCLSFLGFQQFIGDDDMTQELMDEGAELVRREKRRQERKADGEARRKQWTERFGDGSSSSTAVARDIPRNSEIRGKYMVPRSPDENDRTELLRQAEPVDYTEDRSDLPGYQSRPQSSRFTSSRSATRPPKGIFDDI
ncbi:G-protein coupled receptor-associated protein LMBRD2-like [Gigantopelta aegis]|uniref:G-protein coupled receptor-associated protein LMBRD2-like n=1 Tax=Gigantopelta aegis TaxID=1735272 RepID=UPI001B88DA54|nr:G-protein coupled receptor-associated protein LMBRD2-like [Gigantopelta aegis]XP_041359947.1 G-protein coupled receptor-associated protein LMBRD2-like [Gigantopelta aegis]